MTEYSVDVTEDKEYLVDVDALKKKFPVEYDEFRARYLDPEDANDRAWVLECFQQVPEEFELISSFVEESVISPRIKG